ncbi:carbohydrate porin [Bradyrhizobium canariense]|nr:carbohydrate porin [Bradyrhizobium canariense]OSI35568.1 carbohydrate porin [Bradyrhizobium canariense]OSI47814.1 carbohydrate porin [Bradyrhizobium canariense]OSI55240.1 carbohydrate porin [Bradyrhizobium canariense]OSI58310.1 carbohydrate porin [Bradyrhizobium canariense]
MTFRSGRPKGAARLPRSSLPKTARTTIKRDVAMATAKSRIENQIDPFAKFEKLRERGGAFTPPGPADTIDQDTASVRSQFSDLGIGFAGWTLNTLVDNELGNAARSTIANQQYVGQNPTFSTINSMIVTYDLARFGIPDGQIVVGAEHQHWTWQSAGPDRLGLNAVSYYQTLFDRRIELKLGYLRNQHEFAGAGDKVFGPSSRMLFQAGMSNNWAPTPALNLKYNFDDRLYNKFSIQRSVSPAGQYAHVSENPTGLNWSTRDAGILLLDELSYRNKPTPGVMETWLRAGAGFNNSSYTDLQHPTEATTKANSVYYVGADRQFWQSAVHDSASRGVYGGLSAMYAPPDLNRASQYYEIRLYAKGLLDSRPTDQMSLVVSNTIWSHVAVDAALAKEQLAHRDSTAISGLYTAHLAPGIYTTVGLTYINHPTSITYTPQTGHALNILVSTSVFF